MFITKYKKGSTMSHLRIKSKLSISFTSRYSDKWTWICNKNGTKCYNGRFMGRFQCNVLDNIYLQRPIYVWNKISKCIMFWCGVNFQSIPLHITYNFHHFELIDYDNGVLRFFHAFEPNDPKMTINLDEFPLILESIVQQFALQTPQPNLCFYWNENLNSTLMDILTNNWNLSLDYVIS